MKELTPAFVLHARSYRETSLIVDFFTEKYGRLSVVARGARGRNRKVVLQPFSEFLIGVTGSSDLKTLRHYEPNGNFFQLTGEQLFFGMYMNELLTRVLGQFDPMISLYQAYSHMIRHFSSGDFDGEVSLRLFEFQLLSELGYGLVFDYELQTGTQISADQLYSYDSEVGFIQSKTRNSMQFLYSGEDLLAIGKKDFSRVSARAAAKQIARQAISPLLGDRPLNSRDLFKNRSR